MQCPTLDRIMDSMLAKAKGKGTGAGEQGKGSWSGDSGKGHWSKGEGKPQQKGSLYKGYSSQWNGGNQKG